MSSGLTHLDGGILSKFPLVRRTLAIDGKALFSSSNNVDLHNRLTPRKVLSAFHCKKTKERQTQVMVMGNLWFIDPMLIRIFSYSLYYPV